MHCDVTYTHTYHTIIKYIYKEKHCSAIYLTKCIIMMSSHLMMDLVHMEGLMNRSDAPTSTIAITNCSKPLFHHIFYVVVGQNVVRFLHLASSETKNNIA